MATTIGKEPVNIDLQINNANPWTEADFEKLRALRLARKKIATKPKRVTAVVPKRVTVKQKTK